MAVPRIITCAPPFKARSDATVIDAIHMGGVHGIHVMGGLQAAAASAIGTETIQPVDMLVCPGDAYVTAARGQRFGRVGIDLFDGPTNCRRSCAPPAPPGEECGDAILCDDHDEMLRVAEDIASEHVQVMRGRDDRSLQNMHFCGASFLRARVDVANGDKMTGTNHTRPTGRTGYHTRGLQVGKFLKTCSYRRITTDNAAAVKVYRSRLCLPEGFVGPVERCSIRMRRHGGVNAPHGEVALHRNVDALDIDM